MARRRKRDPDILDILGMVLVLGFLVLLADSNLRDALRGIPGLVIALAVFVCVFVVLLAICWIVKSAAGTTDRVAIPEAIHLRGTQSALPTTAEQDDSRYQPKPPITPSDSRYQPKPTKNLSQQVRAIDWFQFEKLIALAYSGTGTVTRKGGANPDGGIDLVMERHSERFGIQCKHWKAWKVGVRNVRELKGALDDAGLKNGIVVTIKGFSSEAIGYAQRNNIQLIGEAEVLELLKVVDQKAVDTILDDPKKLCPKCEREMVLRTATKGFNAGGQFWGCSGYPRCEFILRDASLAQSQAAIACS